MDMYEKELPAINALICIGNDHISSPIFEYIKRSGGARVTVVTNAIEAMNELYDHEYHFFIIAQEFPGCDGIDLYSRMKNKGFINKRTRQIMLLEKPTRALAIKARSLGIDNILIPPFTLHAVSQRMKALYGDQRPKGLTKGVGVMAKNAADYDALKAKAKAATQKKPATGGMKIHAPHETANLVLRDQKIIRKPRKAGAFLAQKSATSIQVKAPTAPKAAPAAAKSPVQAKQTSKRPIESLPPYPGITLAQRQRLMQQAV